MGELWSTRGESELKAGCAWQMCREAKAGTRATRDASRTRGDAW